MKKFNLSIVTVLAMSTFAIAGGDIAQPVMEPVVEAPVVVPPITDDSGLYIGLAYSVGEWDFDEVNGDDDDINDFNTVMFQAGYNFNKYIAVEGRYWSGLDTSNTDEPDNYDFKVDAWGIYVKPQYPLSNIFKIYGLVGYADITSAQYDGNFDIIDDGDVNGFSWGLGATFAFNDNVEVFIDYVSLCDDRVSYTFGAYDEDVTNWNFGITYKF